MISEQLATRRLLQVLNEVFPFAKMWTSFLTSLKVSTCTSGIEGNQFHPDIPFASLRTCMQQHNCEDDPWIPRSVARNSAPHRTVHKRQCQNLNQSRTS